MTKLDAALTEPVAPPLIGPRNRRKLWLLLPVLLLPVLALLFLFNPAQSSFYPFCIFHRMTGWECPGCGGLRAAHQLLHGNVITAFRFNPLLVSAAPVVVFLLLRRWVRGPGQPIAPRTMAVWAWVAFAVLVSFWLLRNLPIEFFQLPTG